MSNSATVPSLWDHAKAAKLDEPGLLLYPLNMSQENGLIV
jgi:hypothetical protein